MPRMSLQLFSSGNGLAAFYIFTWVQFKWRTAPKTIMFVREKCVPLIWHALLGYESRRIVSIASVIEVTSYRETNTVELPSSVVRQELLSY